MKTILDYVIRELQIKMSSHKHTYGSSSNSSHYGAGFLDGYAQAHTDAVCAMIEYNNKTEKI